MSFVYHEWESERQASIGTLAPSNVRLLTLVNSRVIIGSALEALTHTTKEIVDRASDSGSIDLHAVIRLVLI